MQPDSETVAIILTAISKLPPAEHKACWETAEHLRRIAGSAGEPAGTLALALTGIEAVLNMKSITSTAAPA